MDTATNSEFISVEEYYRLEEVAPEKSDYFNGEMFAMAGGTTDHATIGTNLTGSLYATLRGKTCRPFNSDQRIKSVENGLRVYPDASVFCEPLEYDTEDPQQHTATNPTAMFEVLSESTESYDRGFKFESFRKCPSLKAFVLIAQDRPHVDVFSTDETGRWSLDEVTGITESIAIPGIDVTLDLAELYERIEFNAPSTIPE